MTDNPYDIYPALGRQDSIDGSNYADWGMPADPPPIYIRRVPKNQRSTQTPRASQYKRTINAPKKHRSYIPGRTLSTLTLAASILAIATTQTQMDAVSIVEKEAVPANVTIIQKQTGSGTYVPAWKIKSETPTRALSPNEPVEGITERKVKTIKITGKTQTELEESLSNAIKAQRLERERAEKRAKAEEEASLATDVLNDTLINAKPLSAAQTQAIAAMDTCATSKPGGHYKAKFFRSQREMKELNLTGDSVMAIFGENAQRCKITIASAFRDIRIARIPHTPDLLAQWRRALARVGHNSAQVTIASTERGLVFPPSAIRRAETSYGARGKGAGYDAAISWGRDRFSDANLKRVMAANKPLPKDNGNVRYGAMGAYGLMDIILKEHGTEGVDPFDPAQASVVAANLSRTLQRRHGRNVRYIKAAYNGGSGALLAAREKCPTGKLTHACFSNAQTAQYALGVAPRNEKRNTRVAQENADPVGRFFQNFLTGSTQKRRTPAARGLGFDRN